VITIGLFLQLFLSQKRADAEPFDSLLHCRKILHPSNPWHKPSILFSKPEPIVRFLPDRRIFLIVLQWLRREKRRSRSLVFEIESEFKDVVDSRTQVMTTNGRKDVNV
jgi:hypothetical protein